MSGHELDGLRMRLEYLAPLLAATTVLAAELRDVRHDLAPDTWSGVRVADLVELCDLVETLTWDLQAAGGEALCAHADESGEPLVLLPYPPERPRP